MEEAGQLRASIVSTRVKSCLIVGTNAKLLQGDQDVVSPAANYARSSRGMRLLATCFTIVIMRSTASGPRRRRWGSKKCSRRRGRLGQNAFVERFIGSARRAVSITWSCSTKQVCTGWWPAIVR